MVKAWRLNTEKYLQVLWLKHTLMHTGAEWTHLWDSVEVVAGVWLLLHHPFYTLNNCPSKPPLCAKWRYYYWLTSVWTTSQHWLLKKSWKLNPEIKLNRKKKSLIASYIVAPWLFNSEVFINFPLLLTSSPPLLNHDFSPNSSSFPTILNTSHHLFSSHFGFTLCISCSERYITHLLLFNVVVFETTGYCSTSLPPPLRPPVWKNIFYSPPPTTVLSSRKYIITIKCNNNKWYQCVQTSERAAPQHNWGGCRRNRSWEDAQKKESSTGGQSTIVPKQSDFISLQVTASSFAIL